MKIVLSGVETNNKGAELMLYAILQEIEKKFPDATVYIPYSRCKQGLDYVRTSLDFRYTPFSKFIYKSHLRSIFKRLHLPSDWFALTNIVKRCDWFIDGSGFAFSDQFNIKDERVKMWKTMLESLHKQGSRIVFLPQAFGPIDKANTKKALKLVSDNATLVMPRERVSFKYLEQSGIVDMSKVVQYTDFTSLVEGVFPTKYEYLKDGICIIPNMRMIDKGSISYEDYIALLTSIIVQSKKTCHPVYLLNHEGKEDEKLAYKCKESIGNGVEVVTGLNALEVKGLISSAYLVVTSRFHGLASALNCCIPCLATSWSHKYMELLRDYSLSDCILPLNDDKKIVEKVMLFLASNKNIEVRNHLVEQLPKIKSRTQEMWNNIWILEL